MLRRMGRRLDVFDGAIGAPRAVGHVVGSAHGGAADAAVLSHKGRVVAAHRKRRQRWSLHCCYSRASVTAGSRGSGMDLGGAMEATCDGAGRA